MKLVRVAISVACVCSAAVSTLPVSAFAQSEASALSALSAMPMASIVSGASAVAGSVVVVPALLLASGAVLAVKVVEQSASGAVYLLERVSDGARVSVAVATNTAAPLVAGALVNINAIGAGIILTTAGRVIAFIPNETGRQLLLTERVSN